MGEVFTVSREFIHKYYGPVEKVVRREKWAPGDPEKTRRLRRRWRRSIKESSRVTYRMLEKLPPSVNFTRMTGVPVSEKWVWDCTEPWVLEEILRDAGGCPHPPGFHSWPHTRLAAGRFLGAGVLPPCVPNYLGGRPPRGARALRGTISSRSLKGAPDGGQERAIAQEQDIKALQEFIDKLTPEQYMELEHRVRLYDHGTLLAYFRMLGAPLGTLDSLSNEKLLRGLTKPRPFAPRF